MSAPTLTTVGTLPDLTVGLALMTRRRALLASAGPDDAPWGPGTDAPLLVDLAGPTAEGVDAALRAAAASGTPAVLVSVLGADRASTQGSYEAVVAAREAAARRRLPTAVVLRCGPLVQDLLAYAEPLRSGGPLHHAFGPGAAPWTDAADVLDVARAAVATGRTGLAVDVTGEEAVPVEAVLRAAAPGPLEVVALPPEVLGPALRGAGLDGGLVAAVLAHQRWAGDDLPITDTVRRALGRPARGWQPCATALLDVPP